jgi:hypothetical protein
LNHVSITVVARLVLATIIALLNARRVRRDKPGDDRSYSNRLKPALV